MYLLFYTIFNYHTTKSSLLPFPDLCLCKKHLIKMKCFKSKQAHNNTSILQIFVNEGFYRIVLEPCLKFHCHWFALCLIFHLKEFSLSKIKHSGNNIAWKLFNFGIVISHGTVIKTSGSLNFVLRITKFSL